MLKKTTLDLQSKTDNQRDVKSSGLHQQQLTTHYMRTVSGVDQDLVVGVGFPLHLLGAVSSGGLPFAKGRKVLNQMNPTKMSVR